MIIRPLSPEYAVSAQISADDIPEIVNAGYKSVLCNRPDYENMPQDQCDALRQAAEGAGLAFADNPFDHSNFCEDIITTQAQLVADLPKPVLAYCASGNRCSIVWAFTQAGKQPTADILETARAQGYMLDHLAPALDNFANQNTA